MLSGMDSDLRAWHPRAERVRRAVVLGLERVVVVTLLAAVALVFFRPTRRVGRLLLPIWIAVAWPLAWLWRGLRVGEPPRPAAVVQPGSR